MKSFSALTSLALGAVLLAVVANTAGASLQHPNLERGFHPEKAYQLGDLDHVNLFNGNLVITLPIGGEYPVGGGFSYRLQLIYNSKLWDFEEVQPPTGPAFVRAWPNADSNAGLGWQLSLGGLVPPNTHPRNPSTRWMFVAADGSEHLFYPTLHSGEPVVSGVSYTRDGSYLRLKEVGNRRQVETPDGRLYDFSAQGAAYRLDKIQDRFGNFLRITYNSPLFWTLSDSLGRQHNLYFGYRTFDGESLPMLERVRLAAFGGTWANYYLSYQQASVERPCPWDDPTGAPEASVPLLTGVSLPDGGSTFALPFGSYQLDRTPGCRSTGALGKMVLPTLGAVGWRWGTYSFPTGESTPGTPVPPRLYNKTPGVVERSLYGAGDNLVGSWTYNPQVTSEGAAEEPVELVQTVTDPLGHRRVHYFSVYSGGNTSFPTADTHHYGFPYSPKRNLPEGLFLSQDVYDGGSRVRSIFVRYDDDLPGTGGGSLPDKLNQRLARSRSVFRDDADRYSEVIYSDYDGLGHYRQATTAGNFEPTHANTRTVFVGYNPSAGTFPGNFSVPSTDQPWLLQRFDRRWQEEDGLRVESRTCFDDQTGFLKGERVLALPGSARSDDLLRLYATDARGNLASERHYGGDLQPLATGSLDPCDVAPPANPAVEMAHTYQHGSLATSQYPGTGLLVTEQGIDFHTGLPAWSRDVAGLQTDYEYDRLGRQTWSKPSLGHGAWTQAVYDRATSTSSLAKVRVHHRDNGSNSNPILAREEMRFDAFGRPWQERRLLPGGIWTIRDTRRNALGQPVRVSAWETSPSHWTRYLDYDPFGRPRTIEPPEGPSQAVNLLYQGVRKVTRQTWAGTGPDGQGGVAESQFSTVELYDLQGRLYKVIQPIGLTAEYLYDVEDRLIRAKLFGPTAQQRSFAYDRRGFLLSETHPESGQTTYSQYDARGKARRQRSAAGLELRTLYDAAERVTRVEDVSGSTVYPLLEYFYAASNAFGNWRQGKLETAISHSPIRIPWNPAFEADIAVRETYTYGGKDGRVSHRETHVDDALLTESEPRIFTQSWTWDALGNRTSTTYPRCTHSVCAASSVPSRTLSATYTQGRLTGLPGIVNAMSYHANGMVKRVERANGTAEVITSDPHGHARPYTLEVAGPWGISSLGEHRYDGSGNLVQVGIGTDNRYYYDGAGRLRRFGMDSGQWQEYDYDPYGNLTSLRHHNGASTTTRTFAVNAATNRLSVANYDADGNLLAWGGETYAWDALGRMRHHNFPDEVYAYTAGGERILALQYRPGEPIRETWSLRDLDGKLLTTYLMEGANQVGDWAWQKDYAYRGDVQVMAWTAEPSPRHRQYYSVDHLGTPRMVTDAAGGVVSVHHYFGFGEELNTTTTAEPKRFTGHERDFHAAGSQDDLDYMHARYYKAHMGRFLTVDPLDAAVILEQPQSWNKFAYVHNNPVRFSDPTGEKINVAGLTEEEQQTLLAGLYSASGNIYAVDGDGFLQLDAIGGNSSATATEVLNEAIGSPELFTVESSNSSSVILAQAKLRSQRVRIDFDDFRGMTSGNVDTRTFNVGFNFLHEMIHLSRGLSDPGYPENKSSVGPVVEIVNQIRSEQNLPLRGPAYKGQGTRRVVWVNFQVNPSKPNKVYYIKVKLYGD